MNGISFGLSPELLLSKLKEKKIDLIMPDYSSVPDKIEVIRDGRQYNTANYDFAYHTKDGMTYEYGGDGIFKDFMTSSPDVATTEGVRVGDSIEKMKNIYGLNYSEHSKYYQYFNGNEYLYIYYNDNKVWHWMISNASSNTNYY